MSSSELYPYGPFHRCESPTQTPEIAQLQQQTGEIWGKPAHNSHSSDFPKVKAYVGQLPQGKRGIEFMAKFQPDSGTPPSRADWSGPREGVRLEDGFAKIQVILTRNTQV